TQMYWVRFILISTTVPSTSAKRTDKETPYVPIPEGGVKISSHH
ncbi:hypothetical protein ACUOA5_07325, partial [Escherichia coli]